MNAMTPITVKSADLIAKFQDATGWHTATWYVPDGTPQHAGEWACRFNDSLCKRINAGLDIPHKDPMGLIITRVVVMNKRDGSLVSEWPVVPRRPTIGDAA